MNKNVMIETMTLIKDMQKNYAIAMTEASNLNIYNVFKNGYLRITKIQRKIFNIMNKNNMYNLKNIKQTEISSIFSIINKEFIKILK